MKLKKKQCEDETREGESPEFPEENIHTDSEDLPGFYSQDKDNEEIDINAVYDSLFSETEPATVPAAAAGSSSNQLTSELSANRIKLQNEMANYNACSKLTRGQDSFAWWKEHKALFPLLSILAGKYLSSPPSSVESERTFSIGGNIVTRNRARLRSDNAERLIFLNANLPLLPPLDYTKYY